MTVENIGEVTAYFEANKDNEDVKTYLDSFKVQVQPTLEVFKNKLNDPDFKSFFDSEKDKHSSKSLKSWQENNLQGLISAKVKELYPDQDPKDKQIAELKQQFEQMQKDSARKELTNKALKTAQEKKLPAELVDYFIGPDEETTNANLEKFIATMAARDEAIKLEFAKGSSYTPPKDKGGLGTEEEKARAEIAKYMAK